MAGAIAQIRAGHLDSQLFRWMLAPYIVGALVGPWVSRFLPPHFLSVYVAVIITGIALRMLMGNRRATLPRRDYTAHRFEITIVLAGIAVLSSIAGIASGIFAIPYLMARFAVPVRTVIGTSTAAAALYSTVGAIGYVSAGWSVPGLPENALGYVYLPAFLIMAVVASLCTPLGVRLAGHINERILRRVFAVFLLVAAAAIALS